ncbi:Leucine-rich repeat (LRR) family protein [Forsythia ovata]|uniref:Leucine-rich repeat (LRR) family protein n=1 Tax=Forsythia ovata TaxID=205694 RepID=A0ABD1WAI2_9LAMI
MSHIDESQEALNEIKASLGWRVVYAWVGDDPCGDGDLPPWSGVTCTTVSGGDYRVVTELDLHNNKLTGPIPPQIGRLKHLKILNLRWNKLQDSIPPEIGELKQLTHLYLSFNNFKGEIPKELANLPELRYLQLHENRLTGRIPPELGTLPNLRHLSTMETYQPDMNDQVFTQDERRSEATFMSYASSQCDMGNWFL